jgi:hypothetical protein
MIRILLFSLIVAPTVAMAQKKGNDPFLAGSEWGGTRNLKGGNGPQDWSMTITKRDAKNGTFEGTITIQRPKGGPDTYTFIGTAGATKLKFTTEKKGRFKQKFEGEIKGGEIVVDFEGTGIGGDPVSGNARLKPK